MAAKNILELPIIELSGTAQQMGEQLGEMFRQEIHELCDIHYHWTQTIISQTGRYYSDEALFSVMAECLDFVKHYAPPMHDEMAASAKAANIPIEKLCLAQMSDVIDILAFSGAWHRFGCTSAIICPDYSQNQNLLMGQTWDWITEDMRFFSLTHRKPTNGIENWSLGLLGCYSMGMNIHGITTGATNLMTWDAQIGLLRTTIFYNILNSTNIEEALNKIIHVPRASAHYCYLGDAYGIAYGIECSATKTKINKITSGFYVHCNHILDEELKKMEHASPDPSTIFRQQRLSHLLQQNQKISVSHLQTFFSDTEGDELGIRQDNTVGIYSTDGCAIFSPQTKELHACRGQADIGKWHTVVLS